MEDKTVFQPAARGSVRPGARLNGIYEIERLIAEGGMGEVYKGFAIETRDAVAIKMIRPELSRSDDAMALFRREASILHNLQNDAIVRYYVFSIDPDLQRAYLAMEFVDGPSLSDRLAAGPMPLAEVRILKARIAGALEAAHRLGVVHRDISSDNLILPGGDVRRAKIIDFGIARSRAAAEGTIIGGGFAGKYNYVSPEQLGLAGGDVTFKSDIYSLGLVLAEALRGRPIDMGGSQFETIEKRRKVPDLSDIDPAMRPLIQAMLQPAPENRPASMAAVAAWGETGTGEPAPRAGREADAAAPRRASGAGRIAAALAVVIALTSIGGALYVYRDDLRAALGQPPSSVPPPPQPSAGGEAKPPPLPPPPSTGQETPSPPTPSTGQSSGPPPVEQPPPANPPHVPTAEELVDAEPPRAAQTTIAFTEARVGAPFRQELPAFVDPGGKGLTITAEPAPPAGLALRDLGGGRGVIEGTPAVAGTATFAIVARNHNGRTAQMRATIVAAEQQGAPPKLEAPPPPAGPPRASQPEVTLERALVGQDYSAGLPPFDAGANAHGLTLRPEPAPPEGLSFADLGGGLSHISGKPAREGAFAFDVVGVNDKGLTAHMTVKLVVAPAKAVASQPPPLPQPVGPPRPSQTEVTLERALVGQGYNAELPPFDPGANAHGLTLRPEPAPPEGLSFADLGSGLSQLSGKPAREGAFAFDVVGVNDKGLTAHMTVKLLVAPPVAVAPQPPQPQTPASDGERAGAFLRGYDGGACFVAASAGNSDPFGVVAIGPAREAFQRFEAAFQKEVGAEPLVAAHLVVAQECPAVELLRLAKASAGPPPRIDLATVDVGRDRPLAGSVSGLAGRRLVLLAIDNDGMAHRLDAKPTPGEDAASFSAPLVGDAASIGPPQVVLAIVSETPFAGIDAFRHGSAADLARRLSEQWTAARASAAAAFFKLAP